MKTPTFCICENKRTDQHRSICQADQRLVFALHNDVASEVVVIQKSHHNNFECTCIMFICGGIMLNFIKILFNQRTIGPENAHLKQ